MDITTILETVTTTSLSYFFIGSVLGYLLKGFLSSFRSKRPSRYETTKADASKRTEIMAETNEPSFELPDSILKTLTPRRLSSVTIDENINEF
jgi:hypothetical protein